jgi:WD40 repeat protein
VIGITTETQSSHLQLSLRGKLPGQPRKLSFSRDGRILAAQNGSSLVLWNMESGQRLQELSIRSAPEVMAFSPDNRHLAALPGRVWDMPTAAECDEFDHEEGLGVFLLTGETMVTCHHKTGVLCLYENKDGQVVRKRDEDDIPMTLKIPGAPFTTMCLSPDGRWLVVGSKSGSMTRLSVDTLTLDFGQTLTIKKEISALTFSADGHFLVAGDVEGQIHVFDADEWKEMAQLPGTYLGIKTLAFLPGPDPHSPILLSAADDRSLRLWNLGWGKEVWRSFIDDLEVVAVCHDARCVAATAAGEIFIWDLTEAAGPDEKPPEPLNLRFASLERLPADKLGAFAIVDAKPSCFVAASTLVGQVDLWRLNGTLALPQQVQMDSILMPIDKLAVARNGEMVAAGVEGGSIFLWAPGKTRIAKRLAGHADAISCLLFADNMPILASGSRDGSVRVWHREEGRQIYAFNAHPGGVQCLQFDGPQRLLSAGWDATVRVWDLKTGSEVHRLDLPRIKRLPSPHPGWPPPVFSLNLTGPDGPLVASWQKGGIAIQAVSSGRVLRRIERVSASAQALFSGDGRRLALLTGGLFELWDAATGLKRDTVTGQIPVFYEGAMTPDGTYLVMRGQDNRVYMTTIAEVAST